MTKKIKWMGRAAMWLPFHMVLVTSAKRHARLMRWLGIPKRDWSVFPTKPVPGGVGGWVSLFEKKGSIDVCMVVIVPTIGDPAANLSKIVHESVHVYQNLKEAISPRHEMGREPEAYMIQEIYDLLTDEFARQVKKASLVLPDKKEVAGRSRRQRGAKGAGKTGGN